MFPSLATQETLLPQQILRLRSKKMFLNQVKNIFCFTDANFASETYVSQFSLGGNIFTSLATRAAKHVLVLPTTCSLATQETLQETMFLQHVYIA